jgi:hypothetical protein
MGGSSSKNKTEVTNESVNEAVAENIQRLSASGSATQEITVTGNNNTVCNTDMGQEVSVVAKGDFNNDMAAKMQNSVMAKLKASSDSSSNIFGLAGSKAENESKVTNIVKNKFTMKNVQDCLGQLNLNQRITVGGSGNTVCKNKMKQSATLLVNCMNKNTGVMDAINKTVSDVDTSAKSKNQGLLESLVGGCPTCDPAFAGICLGAVVVILLVGGGAYLYLNSQGGQSQYPGQGMDTISSPDIDTFMNNPGVSDMMHSFGSHGTTPNNSSTGSNGMHGGAFEYSDMFNGISINMLLAGCLIVGSAYMYFSSKKSCNLSKALKSPYFAPFSEEVYFADYAV